MIQRSRVLFKKLTVVLQEEGKSKENEKERIIIITRDISCIIYGEM